MQRKYRFKHGSFLICFEMISNIAVHANDNIICMSTYYYIHCLALVYLSVSLAWAWCCDVDWARVWRQLPGGERPAPAQRCAALPLELCETWSFPDMGPMFDKVCNGEYNTWRKQQAYFHTFRIYWNYQLLLIGI